MQNEEYLNNLTHNIIGACMEVHRALGPGLLEVSIRNAFATNWN